MRRLLAAAVLALPLLWPAAPCGAAPDRGFDQGVDVRPIAEKSRPALAGRQGAPGAPAAADAPVWISVSNQDAAALAGEPDFPRGAAVSRGSQVSLYEAKSSELDALAELMRRRLRKSPGFFAHDSLQAAQQDLAAPRAKQAREFTIDQREKVLSLLRRVDEAAITEVVGRLAAYRTRSYRSETGVAASQWIAGRWKELAAGRSDMSVETFRHAGFPQGSVILTLRGSAEPDKVVVLGGHLDSTAGWGDSAAPGADDNASGIAVLSEAIRAAVAAGYRPKRTVKFIAFAAEEAGLRGSSEVAASFKKAGVAVQGFANFDMTNFKGSAADIYFISDNSDPSLNAFLGRLIETYTDYRWGETECGYGCSDHASWTKNGFSASFPFESKNGEDNPNIHSAKDTLAQTGGGCLQAAKFARLAVAYLVEMAK